ncbi:MAG: macro domain-containing protein [Pseudomonadota bacterium]
MIVHGCNCMNTMGAGIAKSIAAAFPEAFSADKATLKGDVAKLGTISRATVIRDGVHITIVNAYTQFDYKGRGRKVDYDALRSCFRAVGHEFPNARIGYPMIGAGLAGGDWDKIAPIINQELSGCDHCLVIWAG